MKAIVVTIETTSGIMAGGREKVLLENGLIGFSLSPNQRIVSVRAATKNDFVEAAQCVEMTANRD